MAFSLDDVKSLLENNSVYELINDITYIKSVISHIFKKSPMVYQRKSYEYLAATKIFKREILVKPDVKDLIKNAIALR